MRVRQARSRLDSEDGVSDEALLAGIADNDEQAMVSFVRRYQRRVFGLAVGLTGEAGVAEEIAQEAMVRVWRHAAVFDPRRGSASTWVLSIARNLAIDALRMRRAMPLAPDVIVDLLNENPNSPPDLTQSQTAELVRAALATLPEEQRRAIVLSSLYGYTALEVSVAEAISLGTAKSRIRIGLTKLRANMALIEQT